jgi:hypothetical protein
MRHDVLWTAVHQKIHDRFVGSASIANNAMRFTGSDRYDRTYSPQGDGKLWLPASGQPDAASRAN